MADQRKFKMPHMSPLQYERSRGWREPVPYLSQRVPASSVAPDRSSETITRGTADAFADLLVSIEPHDKVGQKLLLGLIDHLIEYYTKKG